MIPSCITFALCYNRLQLQLEHFKKGNTMKAIGYVRVSTEDQASGGVSLSAQRAKIVAWCSLNDADLTAVFVETKSGKRADNREQLQLALNACCKDSVLIVYSLSRLARSTKDTIHIAEQLDKAGADLVSLSEKIDTTNAAGKMVFRMLAVLAEFERDQISERTATALQHKKTQGERVGSIPYGYRLASDGIHLESDRKEQEIIAIVKTLRADGLSLRQIADRLTAAGWQPRGKKWHAQSITNILEAA